MKKKPLLTIGIPAYNVELYIEDTVLSVAKSKLHDQLEILIINDGSSDHTLEVATRMADMAQPSMPPLKTPRANISVFLMAMIGLIPMSSTNI